MPPCDCDDLYDGDSVDNSGCRLVSALLIFFRIHIVVYAHCCSGVKSAGRGFAS
jgi:hypothetical protein